ncbi:MAG: GGDEF domain-containing protein [Sulfuricurvum sp.]|uniref:GGDEF domain-containing protein n=1 Tax=Sulfuricurvum sp. TaxID=2025608 RepID=UPI002604828F|nr:GGDEF domain-containing protein [Sulfuricurvum sp.]MDD2950229.1 GGDEF domain-containing protein [Sulfuricurvum sp.]MDD5117286.1 GGDEF domain-containing protein [Sulfuricurvum sp.]
MRGISIELKMIIGAILFAMFLVGYERFQFSENIVQQFLESKKSKNKLLIDTISPVIGLNISLGLNDANTEYLNQIVKQNSDLLNFDLIDSNGFTIFHFEKNPLSESQKIVDGIRYASQIIKDPVTGESVGTVHLYFDDHEYQAMMQKNREITLKIFGISFVMLMIFILFVKKEFKFLKKLSEHVLQYDPQINNFTLQKSDRTDEVGVIHNAIISMVDKINGYATLLDDLNHSLAIKVEERTQELQEANLQLKELSLTDSLTHLSNRRSLAIHLQEIWELAKRHRSIVSIIMCDIDHFKQVNDKYGHIVGDTVLKDIANILQVSLKRKSDFLARYGGEEFMIVLYEVDIHAAEELCISIQKNLKNIGKFEYKEVKLNPITMSFGISSTVPDEASEYNDLIKLADTALYQAKKSGRNRFISMNQKN